MINVPNDLLIDQTLRIVDSTMSIKKEQSYCCSFLSVFIGSAGFVGYKLLTYSLHSVESLSHQIMAQFKGDYLNKEKTTFSFDRC